MSTTTEHVFATTDKLSEVIQNMQKCLQCIICLHTISKPVKTRCGHRFCHECIQRLLQSTNATCPLCNSVLQRRTVSKDEHMEMYINKLEKLIEAIQTDSGIDITLHVSRPRSACESTSSVPIENPKYNQQDHAVPSCSNTNRPSFSRRSGSNSNSKSQKSKTTSRKSRERKDSAKTSDITKYLNKFISGVEPLPPDEPTYCHNDSTNRVQSWLETLPDDEVLDDPNKALQLPLEYNLDDTLTYSISQNRTENKIDKFTADDTVAGKLDNKNESNERDAKHRRLSKESRKEGSNDEVGNSRGECQKSSEPRKTSSKVNQMEPNCDDQEPSTSGICRLTDDDKEKSAQTNAHNQDKMSDIHRTSPNDMLPVMKKNWSSVVQFGKEMRTKRKKLKSLNVSIENKKKTLSHESLKETGSISGTITKSNRKRKENRSDTCKVVANAYKHYVEESLQTIESAQVREESSPTNQDNRSNAGYVPPAGDSSFIMLEEGEQVHIRNLNSYQMNDIIGVADCVEDRENAEIENVRDNGDPEGNTLSLEKRGRISKIQDRSESPLQVTSVKRTIEDSPDDANDSVPVPADKRASLSEVKKVDTTEESTFRFQSSVVSQTPNHKRLSLRRRSTEPKSNESPSVDPVSRLLAVKRDLYRQIDQNEGKGDNGGDVVQVAMETNGKSEGNSRKENRDVKGVSLGSRDSSASDGSVGRKRPSEKQDRHLVTFRKLGKVVKQRRKPVTFLYLGSTRHSRNQFAKLPKMYDSVQHEVNVLKFDARGKDSDSNTRIALDDSATKAQDEKDKDDALMEKVKGRTNVRREESAFDQLGSSTNKVTETLRINIYRESKSKQASPITDITESKSEGSDDVLLVSLYDNEEKVPSCVERDECRSKSSVTEKTASKGNVRMISPKKDSQLKSLWLDSPTTDSAKVSDIAQQSEVTKDNSAKKSHFSDIRGAHSRALIRKSQQALEVSEPCSSSTPKKRKRSPIRENLVHRLKRKSEEGREDPIEKNASDSEGIGSKATYVINPDLGAKEAAVTARADDNEKCSTASSTVNDAKSVFAIFDTDTDDPKNIETQRKTKRRVIPVISSDTDSSSNCLLACSKTNTNVSAIGDEVATSPMIKRRRTLSSDSDETGVDVIVKSWYANVSFTDRCTKKGKVELSRASGTEKKKDASTKLHKSIFYTDSNAFSKASVSQRRHLHELDVGTNSEKPCSLSNKRQETLSRDVFDDDSPDFGATIDRIRDMQKSPNVMTVNDKDSNKSRHGNYSLMQDNFDDIIANVDTEALLEDNPQAKDSQLIHDSRKRLPQIEKPSEPGRSTACFRSSNDAVTCQSNSSDKENRYRAAKKVYESESDDDRTLTEYRNVSSSNTKKDSTDKNKLLDRLRPVESTSKDLKNSIHGVHEQDSIDVTQHYLILKQFEEDLFNKPSNSKGAEMEKLAKERTPPQKLKSTNVEDVNSKGAEHSGEEDDIVENTPDVKTRSIQPTSIASKRSSTSSPISSMNKRRSAASPSSVAERSTSTNTTPTRKKDVPMYQSTPRARALEKSNYVATVCASEKKLDPATSASKFADKQMKGVAGKSARTVASKRFCFVCSGLLATQIENVKKLAQMVNARYVTQFEQEVTHVIVKLNPKNNGTNKTLKYLQGVVYRKWIVGYQWVIDSLTRQRLVPEEPYEAVDCTTLEAGPRNSRLSKEGLFEEFAFLCIGPYVDVSTEQYQELLRATGAAVVDSLNALAAEKRRLKVIAIPVDVYDDEVIIGWYKKARAVSIVYEWVVECISQYKLLSFYRYLQELSQQDVRKLGYPEFLLEEDADEDCDSA